MKINKRNIYIVLFAILYVLVSVVSLLHSFAFFELANSVPKAVMLGICFEIGQVAVLMSLLTSKREQSRIMPWCLMFILTAVQIIGNIFSSYKYLILNSPDDLRFFKEPIFVWTSLPDNITTVIITYIVGAILPIIALCMTAMVSNYLQEGDEDEHSESKSYLQEGDEDEHSESESYLQESDEDEQSESNKEMEDNSDEDEQSESNKEMEDNNYIDGNTQEQIIEEPKYIQDPTLGCDVIQPGDKVQNEIKMNPSGFVNL